MIVWTVVVHPDLRRLGLGRTILRGAMELARARHPRARVALAFLGTGEYSAIAFADFCGFQLMQDLPRGPFPVLGPALLLAATLEGGDTLPPLEPLSNRIPVDFPREAPPRPEFDAARSEAAAGGGGALRSTLRALTGGASPAPPASVARGRDSESDRSRGRERSATPTRRRRVQVEEAEAEPLVSRSAGSSGVDPVMEEALRRARRQSKRTHSGNDVIFTIVMCVEARSGRRWKWG